MAKHLKNSCLNNRGSNYHADFATFRYRPDSRLAVFFVRIIKVWNALGLPEDLIAADQVSLFMHLLSNRL